MIRLVLRGREPRWLAPVLDRRAPSSSPIVLTAGPIRWAGANPMAAYRRYVITPLTSGTSIGEVLLTSTPLLFTGLAVAIAFRAGFYNIGAEGQFLVGAVAATWVGTTFDGLPASSPSRSRSSRARWPARCGSSSRPCCASRFRIDEVVTTLLLNPVALLLRSGSAQRPVAQPGEPVPGVGPRRARASTSPS